MGKTQPAVKEVEFFGVKITKHAEMTIVQPIVMDEKEEMLKFLEPLVAVHFDRNTVYGIIGDETYRFRLGSERRAEKQREFLARVKVFFEQNVRKSYLWNTDGYVERNNTERFWFF